MYDASDQIRVPDQPLVFSLKYSGLHRHERHEHRIGALMPDRTLHGVTSLKEV